jgi:hypothetical protein
VVYQRLARMIIMTRSAANGRHARRKFDCPRTIYCGLLVIRRPDRYGRAIDLGRKDSGIEQACVDDSASGR